MSNTELTVGGRNEHGSSWATPDGDWRIENEVRRNPEPEPSAVTSGEHSLIPSQYSSTVAKCDSSAEASGQHPENLCPDAWIVSWNQLDQNVQLRSSRVSDTISGEFSNDETPKTPKLESLHLPPLRIRPRVPGGPARDLQNQRPLRAIVSNIVT